jgi:EmrB/QacA subfamily drug resistance transporter
VTAKPPGDEGVIQARPHAVAISPAQETWILVATILGSSMVFIDGTVVNIALPTLQRTLGATATDVQWVIEAYALFLASLLLVGGALGDLFGRRRLYTIGIAVFTAASIVCGLSPTIGFLIFARAAQGIGGALLTPGSLAIISASFRPEKRGRAIGTWSGFTTLTSVIGPVLGGLLIQTLSWRFIFFINVPLAAVTLYLVSQHVPESRDEAITPQLDWWGAATCTLGLGLIVYGLISADTLGLGNGLVLGTLIGGLAVLAFFLYIETRVSEPMMPLTLFSSRTFSGTNLLTLLLYGALGGALYFMPFTLQQVQGYTPAEAGAVFLPFTALMFSLSRWAGGLVTRYGSKLPLVVGPSIAALGFCLFAIPGTTGGYWTTYFPAIVVLGIGMSITVAPLTTTVMGAVSTDQAGIASGINNAVSRAAGLLAIAILGLVMVGVFEASLTSHLSSVGLTSAQQQAIEAQKSKLAGIVPPHDVPGTQRAQVTAAVDDSFLAGFRIVMFIAAGMALASAAIAGAMVEGTKARRVATALAQGE